MEICLRMDQCKRGRKGRNVSSDWLQKEPWQETGDLTRRNGGGDHHVHLMAPCCDGEVPRIASGIFPGPSPSHIRLALRGRQPGCCFARFRRRTEAAAGRTSGLFRIMTSWVDLGWKFCTVLRKSDLRVVETS